MVTVSSGSRKVTETSDFSTWLSRVSLSCCDICADGLGPCGSPSWHFMSQHFKITKKSYDVSSNLTFKILWHRVPTFHPWNGPLPSRLKGKKHGSPSSQQEGCQNCGPLFTSHVYFKRRTTRNQGKGNSCWVSEENKISSIKYTLLNSQCIRERRGVRMHCGMNEAETLHTKFIGCS